MQDAPRRALVVGSTGIAGAAVGEYLVEAGWDVAGLARTPSGAGPIRPIAADLRDPDAVRSALASERPTHVFLTTWLRQATEAENCAVNGAMVRNLLEALRDDDALEHVALVTGLKHYLGSFDEYASGPPPPTPFREEQPRRGGLNFYYVQEDAVIEAAAARRFSYSVHRPHTLIGVALGNAMNMGQTLAVYATICRETRRPFVFPGSPTQWYGLTDMTDASLLAEQLAWASTSPAGRNEAFNCVDGDVFRWSWLWPQIADWFGIASAPYPDRPTPLVEQLADAAPAWREIAARYRLREPEFDRVASPWHTDADLGRPIECVTDMSKSRAAGFSAYRDTRESFRTLFARLRDARIVPDDRSWR